MRAPVGSSFYCGAGTAVRRRLIGINCISLFQKLLIYSGLSCAMGYWESVFPWRFLLSLVRGIYRCVGTEWVWKEPDSGGDAPGLWIIRFFHPLENLG